ncbi:MAG: hypothetical protein HDT40_02935 [Lachnospiraceae bacterium]|nr:hypothetical protein [Lachnospiraceae bacterium]
MNSLKRVKKILFSVWTILVISNFPALFMYFKNAGEAGIAEIIRPLFIFSAMGIFVLLISFLFIKDISKATLTAIMLIVSLCNFRPIEAFFEFFFRSMRYWHVLPVTIVLIIFISMLIIKTIPKDLGEILVTMLGVVITALIVINAFIAIPNIRKYVQNHKVNLSADTSKDSIAVDDNLPNVYLLIFDEYAGFEQMEKYYGYDNEELKDFLSENNFNVSKNSHNEWYETHVCISNLVNLDYVVSPYMTAADAESIRKNGRLFLLMQELGYNVQVVENGDFLGQYSPTRNASNTNAGTINGETLENLLLKRTVIYPFLRENVNALIADIVNLCEYMADSNNIPQMPTFTIFYVCFPHQPFFTDENGNRLSADAFANWENDEYYLGQYKYSTKLMIKILENLVNNDPNSIIFVQSDHGARASCSEQFLVKFSENDMTGILNVVYCQGKNIENIDGKSAVNTIRIVLDELFDLGLGGIEVPQYIIGE